MQTARVSSIEALRQFRASLHQFILQADKAIIEADLELDRVCDWVQRDRPGYWAAEIKRRHDLVQRAKDDLRRAQFTVSEHTPSAPEQKKALKTAEARLEEARRKAELTRRWQRQMEQAANEYRSQMQHIATAVESDLPRALALLENATRALDSYTAVTAPTADDDLVASSSTAGSASAASAEVEDPLSALELDACIALRRITVAARQRSEESLTPRAEDDDPESRQPQPAREPILFRDRLPIERIKPGRGAALRLDPRAFESDRIFLERSHVEDSDDSGWYVGVVERVNIAEIEELPMQRTTIGDLLQSQPRWRELLSLPHGFLVLLEAGEIRRLIDPHNVDLWEAAATDADATASQEESNQ